MTQNISQKIISNHLASGEMTGGSEISIQIDQTLTQDATGTMAYLQFEAIGIARVKTEVSVSYVDHNLLQTDFRNADDHRYLQSVAAKYGLYFSRPGNGVSHQVHLERFGKPGKTLLGSDSHTPTGGGLGMLAIGAGGLDVAMAMAGRPFNLKMPKIVGVELTGRLRPWVSAKDIVLEVIRRLTVKGGVGRILEYYGPGVETLDVPSRASICNMGTEAGATSSVFPSDQGTLEFLRSQDRESDWTELSADQGAGYDEIIKIDLSSLEPLIAQPSSPDRVVKVSEISGSEVSQVILGSCANSSLRDLLVAARVLEDRTIHPDVSFEVNPGSRQVLENLAAGSGYLSLVKAGARIHQPGCLGCIGMGQAPATGTRSLRTFTRNFPGRSGTKDDSVFLCSPEVAVAAAITGVITDPRELGEYPDVLQPAELLVDDSMILSPVENTADVEIIRGPNIQPLPRMDPLPADVEGVVLLKVGDNISTDDIMPAGAAILPLRSNVPAISEFVFTRVDPSFAGRAKSAGGGFIVGGENYGQGSSREHAALAPRYLGVIAVIAKSYARIHKSNLVNFGILPLEFKDSSDYDIIKADARVKIAGARDKIKDGHALLSAEVCGQSVLLRLDVSAREREVLLAGGLLNYVRKE
ncbi:2,3-dimethylmalate dehydratase large subunit [archaeon BMS3Abin16]|nr:2,3-dimethylmalate dehydratase large subunit [archaeon BMS3Abin16]